MNAPRPPATREAGFTLITVLAALAILSFGLLGLAKTYLSVTLAATQNQNINSISNYGNGFWGVLQANPSIIPGLGGQSYTAATICNAPAQLQPWLYEVIQTAALPACIVTPSPSQQGLPNATVSITTAADAATGAACSATGCSVVMTISWLQNATPGNTGAASQLTRTQTFNYQFGL